MRKDCIGCPLFNGVECKVKRLEEVAVQNLGTVKSKITADETTEQKTNRVRMHFNSLEFIRSMGHKTRKSFGCPYNDKYIPLIIRDQV